MYLKLLALKQTYTALFSLRNKHYLLRGQNPLPELFNGILTCSRPRTGKCFSFVLIQVNALQLLLQGSRLQIMIDSLLKGKITAVVEYCSTSCARYVLITDGHQVHTIFQPATLLWDCKHPVHLSPLTEKIETCN